MFTSRSIALGFAVCASAALVVGGSACTITSASDASDGGPDNDTGTTPDGSTSDGGTHTTPDGGTGVLGFQPSNLGSLLEGLDLSKLVDIDVTTEGTTTGLECGVRGAGCLQETVTQADGSTVNVYIAKSWKIEPNVTANIDGKIPQIIVALTTIDVLGGISASAGGMKPGAAGYSGNPPTGDATGTGPGAGGVGDSDVHSAEGQIGGGGAGHCGAGGKGGRATATVGLGGATYGNATLVPLTGGSSGAMSLPGAGGGAFQLVAGTSITIESAGKVTAGGGGGYGNSTSSAGGGAGGAILLEAPTVTILGALAANGGGAGASGGTRDNGKDATGDAVAAPGGLPGTLGAGGAGAAGTSIVGVNGAIGDGIEYGYGAAGGGGGVGWLRINTRTGAATISGTVSPATTTTCASQGTLN